MHYLSIFFKRFNKPCVNFSRIFDEKRKALGNFEKIVKIFDENAIEKLNFFIFIRKFVTKNRAFGNNTIFLQQFFRFRGGGNFPLSTGYAIVSSSEINSKMLT